MTADDVIREVLKDEIFYINSGGGMTLSGGEPLAQAGFSAAVLKGCHARGLHTAVETAGHIDWLAITKVIPYTDLFLYDLKCLDPEIHKQYVGVCNTSILSNLKKLAETGKKIIVRVPVIPEFNDDIESVAAISSHVAGLGIRELHLLPYHRFGKSKYRLLGRQYPFPGKQEPSCTKMKQLEQTALSWGLKVTQGG